MKRFGDHSSLNAVFRAKRTTLEHLRLALKDLKRELDRDYELRAGKKKRAFTKFRELIERPFSTLNDRVSVLRFAAEADGTIPELRQKCLHVCDEMEKLKKTGNRLMKVFTVRRNVRTSELRARVRRARDIIDGTIDETHRIEKLL